MLRTITIAIACVVILISAGSLESLEEMFDLSESELSSKRDIIGNYRNDGGSPNERWNRRNKLPIKYDQHDECGINTIDYTFRILNGRQAKDGEFPWLVQVILDDGEKCGGTIISRNFILTAAHCTSPGMTVQVIVGLYYILASSRRLSADSFIHPEYDDSVKGPDYEPSMDVALLRLERPLEWNEYVRPICLPDATEAHLDPGTMLTVAGRGKTESKFYSWGKVKTADLPIVDVSECYDTKEIPKKNFSKTMRKLESVKICAGRNAQDNVTEPSICFGDSGGPGLIRRAGKKNQWFIAGVMSAVTGSCSCGCGYSIFTKVTGVLDWIYNVIDNDRKAIFGGK